MDSEFPHCTICLKPTYGTWRCAEHSDIDEIYQESLERVGMTKDKQQLLELIAKLRTHATDLAANGYPIASDPLNEAAEAIQSLLVENERLREGLTQIVEETKYVENPYARLAWKIARTLLGDS